jgi:hypothetical protein
MAVYHLNFSSCIAIQGYDINSCIASYTGPNLLDFKLYAVAKARSFVLGRLIGILKKIFRVNQILIFY